MNLWVVVPILLFLVLWASVVLFGWTSWKLWGDTSKEEGKAVLKKSLWLYVALAVTHFVGVSLSGVVLLNFKKK